MRDNDIHEEAKNSEGFQSIFETFICYLPQLNLSTEDVINLNTEQAARKIKQNFQLIANTSHPDKTKTKHSVDFDELRHVRNYLRNIVRDKSKFHRLKKRLLKREAQKTIIKEATFDAVAKQDLEAIPEDFEKAERHFNAGQQLKEKNNPEYAIGCFKKAVKKDVTCLRYATALSELLYVKKLYEGARQVLLTAQQRAKNPTDHETAKLYYLLAVLSAELNDDDRYPSYLQSAQNIDKEKKVLADLIPVVKNVLQQLQEKCSKESDLTRFIEAEKNNNYDNETPLPDSLEERLLEGMESSLSIMDQHLVSLEKKTEKPEAFESSNNNRSLVLVPQQSSLERVTNASINYVNRQLYQMQIQTLSQDIGLQNLQSFLNFLNDREKALLSLVSDWGTLWDWIRGYFYDGPKLLVQGIHEDKNVFLNILTVLLYPVVLCLTPVLIPASAYIKNSNDSKYKREISLIRNQKQKVKTLIEKLGTSTEAIIAFIKKIEPITDFGPEHLEWLKQSEEIDEVILETNKQFHDIKKSLKPFSPYLLSLVLYVRWGDYHLWSKNLFIKAAKYYQVEDEKKAQQLADDSKKHIEAANENFEKAIHLIAKRNETQLISPLMLVYLTGTLLEYWHYRYYENNNVTALAKEVQLRDYREFISQQLKRLNLGRYFGESQAFLSWLPYFNSPYIDRENYLQTFKIICMHLKLPTLSTMKSDSDKESRYALELFSATLPGTQQKLNLAEEIIVGDGNCGFNAMGISREECADALLKLKENQTSRSFLAQEILNEFKLQSLGEGQVPNFPQQNQWRILLKKMETREEKRNKMVAQILHQYRLPKETVTMNPEELARYLANSAQYPKALAKLTKLNQAVSRADQKLLDFCQQTSSYEYYVKQYRGVLWLGCFSALLYAKAKRINLYIWEKSDKTKALKLKKSETCREPLRTVHMLFTGNCTHFNVLVELQNDEKSLALQAMVRDYQSLLQLFPDSANLHNNLATLYENQSRFEKAEIHYQRAMQLDPEHPIPIANLNRRAMERGDYDKAVDGFEEMYNLHFFQQCSELKSVRNPYIKLLAPEKREVVKNQEVKMEERKRNFKEKQDFDSTVKRSKPKIQFKFLAIDGGGIRGIIPAMVLADIEKEVQEPIANCFDLLTGTSTGGIISLALTCPTSSDYPSFDYTPKFSAEEVIEIYTNHGSKIFEKSLIPGWDSAKQIITYKYEPDGLITLLKEYFGTSTMSQALTEVIVPTYCLNDNQPYFIDRKNPYGEWRMWKAARCTSAAPTYFPPQRVRGKRFIDGGVYENNPVMCGFNRALQKGYNASDLYIVSLGTGNFMKPLDACDQGILCRGGYTSYGFKIFDIASNGISQSFHLKMQGLFATRDNERKRYHRINVELNRNIPLDDASSETISDLQSLGREAIEENRDALNEICRVLK